MLKNFTIVFYLLQSSRNFIEPGPIIPSLFDNPVGDQLLPLGWEGWRIFEYIHRRIRVLNCFELGESRILFGLGVEVGLVLLDEVPATLWGMECIAVKIYG